MRGTVLYGPGDIRFDDCETPKIAEPTGASIRISRTWDQNPRGALVTGRGATKGHS
jgi:hypothetical protein